MSFANTTPDPDDFFAETRMSFGEHLEDLRTHLWRAVKGADAPVPPAVRRAIAYRR